MSKPSDNELLGIDNSVPIYEACGCKACNNTGYKGRTAIHEILLCTPEMASLIANGANATEIQQLAKKNGTKILRDNVAELVMAGSTTMEELVRVTFSI